MASAGWASAPSHTSRTAVLAFSSRSGGSCGIWLPIIACILSLTRTSSTELPCTSKLQPSFKHFNALAMASPPCRSVAFTCTATDRSHARARLFWIDGQENKAGNRSQQERLPADLTRSEEHTSELQSLAYLVCRLLLEKKKKRKSRLSGGMQKTTSTLATANS